MTPDAQKKIEETARLAAEAVIKRGGTVKEANEAGNKAAAAAAKAAVEAAKSVGAQVRGIGQQLGKHRLEPGGTML